jgi:hypothetical protein
MYFKISVILFCYVMLVVVVAMEKELVGLLVTASSTSYDYSSNSSCSGSGSCNSSCGSNSFGASNTSLGRWHQQAATAAVARCSGSGSNDMNMMNDDE